MYDIAILEKFLIATSPYFKKAVSVLSQKDLGVGEKHHILPKSYFRKFKLRVDNSKENLIELSPKNHFLLHYYYAKCAQPFLKDSLWYAVGVVAGFRKRKLESLSEAELEELADKIQEAREKMAQVRKGKTWVMKDGKRVWVEDKRTEEEKEREKKENRRVRAAKLREQNLNIKVELSEEDKRIIAEAARKYRQLNRERLNLYAREWQKAKKQKELLNPPSPEELERRRKLKKEGYERRKARRKELGIKTPTKVLTEEEKLKRKAYLQENYRKNKELHQKRMLEGPIYAQQEEEKRQKRLEYGKQWREKYGREWREKHKQKELLNPPSPEEKERRRLLERAAEKRWRDRKKLKQQESTTK